MISVHDRSCDRSQGLEPSKVFADNTYKNMKASNIGVIEDKVDIIVNGSVDTPSVLSNHDFGRFFHFTPKFVGISGAFF